MIALVIVAVLILIWCFRYNISAWWKSVMAEPAKDTSAQTNVPVAGAGGTVEQRTSSPLLMFQEEFNSGFSAATPAGCGDGSCGNMPSKLCAMSIINPFLYPYSVTECLAELDPKLLDSQMDFSKGPIVYLNSPDHVEKH